MIFELVADLKRYQSDKKYNEHTVTKVSHERDKVVLNIIRSDELKVGDILKLNNGEMVPADCLVLSTGEINGMCYISTETLDGELNLKPKLSPTITQGKLKDLVLNNSKIDLSYINPDRGIYTFNGLMSHLETSETHNELELKNFIPRGAVLKNSEDVYVCVLYTGPDTKLVLN